MEHLAWLLRTVVPLSSFGFLPTRRAENLVSLPIVILGCDTGMGRSLVERLGNELKVGRIYAGCFTEEARRELQKSAWCRPFTIDVRDAESVTAAARMVESLEPNGVFVVANIAGAM
jgi:NAD(P)-dependent dehydrogenase (short-subunit alcohol dehydrogenase family)